MPTQHKDAWLVIKLVRDGLQRLAKERLRNRSDSYASLNPILQRLSQLSRSYDHACRRCFTGACNRLEPRIAEQMRLLTQQIQHVSASHHASASSGPHTSDDLPSPAFLLAELEQIESEFGDWQLASDQQSLFVTTDPITLEGILLGPFEIELCLNRLDQLQMEQPLRIHALEPNWASGSEEVSHPHVRNEILCTGDATSILTQALREGRLADYLLIVRNVLNTYNPDSPHVALAEWDGVPCHDCGCSMIADDRYYCDGCERDFCDECFGCCQGCSTAMCYSCLSSCSHCDDTTCESCLKQCSECEQSCCSGCLEDSLCPECYEQKELDNDDSEEDQEPETIQSPQTQVQATQTNPITPSPQAPAIPAVTFAGTTQPPASPGLDLDGGIDRRVAAG